MTPFRFLGYAAAAAVTLLLAIILSGSLGDRYLPIAFSGKTRTVGNASYRLENGETGVIELPHTFSGLPPRTKVVITADIEPKPDESLLVKTFYAPLEVYADDLLIASLGQTGSYPPFLKDPPTIISMLSVPRSARQLRLEYLSPTQRGRLDVKSILIGKDMALYARLYGDNFISFSVSLVLLFFGAFVILLTFFLLRGLPRIHSLLWLGLFSISAGVWGLGECDFSLFLIPYPTLLYVMAFVGLYSLPVTLLMYGIAALDPLYKRPLRVLASIDTAALITVLALQASGTSDLSRYMVLFHFLAPFSFAAFFAVTLLEYWATGRREALRFGIPTFILVMFSVLEVVNYRFRFTELLSLFFLTGVTLFIFHLGLIGGWFVTEAVKAARAKDRLAAEMSFMSMTLDARRDQYAKLTEDIAKTAATRHDLRHNIAAMRRYAEAGDARNLTVFLDKIADNIKPQPAPVCENFAVNAVVGHYAAIAAKNGIGTEICLDIPEDTGRVEDMDLCVIMGNLLENAVEASIRADGPRFVRIIARTVEDTLTMIVENSFSGTYEKDGDVYISSKRGENGETRRGIGIISVREACRKYGGLLEIDAEENLWRASALVDLTGHLSGEPIH
jgi:hypothetical protein